LPVRTSAGGSKSITETSNPRRELGLKLAVIARQLRQRFDQSMESAGITRAQWSLIIVVARNPGATQRMIADMLEVSEVTAGRLIDRLCAEGFLERRENRQDRRAYCVYLTEAAQPTLDRLSEIATISENEAFAGLSDEDIARLDELLSLIARNLADARGRPRLAAAAA
jgi:MarR family transcriptional regulator, transcriptional regulator for hemolysin